MRDEHEPKLVQDAAAFVVAQEPPSRARDALAAIEQRVPAVATRAVDVAIMTRGAVAVWRCIRRRSPRVSSSRTARARARWKHAQESPIYRVVRLARRRAREWWLRRHRRRSGRNRRRWDAAGVGDAAIGLRGDGVRERDGGRQAADPAFRIDDAA